MLLVGLIASSNQADQQLPLEMMQVDPVDSSNQVDQKFPLEMTKAAPLDLSNRVDCQTLALKIAQTDSTNRIRHLSRQRQQKWTIHPCQSC